MAATAATTKVTRTILTAIMLVVAIFIFYLEILCLLRCCGFFSRIENAFFRFEEGAKNKYSTPIDKNDDDNDA